MVGEMCRWDKRMKMKIVFLVFLLWNCLLCSSKKNNASNISYSIINDEKILYQLPTTHNIFHGHSRSCFSYAILSYESCRQLFVKYDTCTYLKYENSICSLHNHHRNDFEYKFPLPDSSPTAEMTTIDSGRIILTKLSLNQSIPTAAISALRKYRKCISKDRKSEPEQSDYDALPKLAIVITVTSEWVEAHATGVKSLTSNFECYASVHNYSFHLNILPNMPASKFYYQRHRSILHNYLPYFQHVLHLDADSLILNHSRSLDSYLTDPLVDIHLHLHENSEITAAIYLIRNSLYSKCFLDYWSNFSPSHVDIAKDLHSLDGLSSGDTISGSSQYSYYNTYEVPNYDNGDLVSAVFNLLYPKKYSECISVISKFNHSFWNSLVNPYHQTIVECWKTTHGSLYRYLRRNIIPKTKLMIYYPHEGFWRTKGRMNRFGNWWDNLFGKCFPSSDLIGHGWKAMARTLWPLPSQELSTADLTHHLASQINVTELYLDDKKGSIAYMMQSTCNIELIKSGKGANSRCQWMSADEELHISQKYCLWRSKVCTNNRGMISSRNCDGNETQLCFSSCVLEEPSTCLRHLSPEVSQHRSLTPGSKMEPKRKSQKDRKERVSPYEELFHHIPMKFGVEYEEWWMGQLCATCPI